MKSLLCGLAALACLVPAAHAQPAPDDPFQWLEDIEAPRSMAWVEGQNARSAKRLEADPRYETFHKEALAIFTAQDRIPQPRFRAGGIDNFWQDGAHVHGVWRHTTAAAYRTAAPAWETLLDLDALSKAEGRNWIWKGATCLKPAQALCLVRLSDGGSDAVEVREYDTATRRFVAGGFRFANAKQDVEWLDPNTVIIARPGTPDEVTPSGYAYVVRIVGRDGKATEAFRGQKSDVRAGANVLRGAGGHADGVLAERSPTFFEHEYDLLTPRGALKVALPLKAEFETYVDGQLVFALKQAWNGFGAGALIAYDLKDLGRDPAAAKAQLVFQPGPHQAIQQVDSTRDRLVVDLLEDVKGAVDVYARQNGRWVSHRLALPKDANLTLVDVDDQSDSAFFDAEGFLDPTALWLADAASGAAARVKSLPARFDGSRDLVEQYWATSTDGTKIPYFVVRPKAAKLDGSTPTLMYGYGGFELAKPPVYLPEMGRIWLQRGGAYVIANIRGGGEFGPAWHDAVLREKRQLAFDDFAAVAKDMTARGITSPRRLGIYGRSNGGVLTTVSMTQHPELWNAVVVESPLVDMLRYQKLSAGASWIGEYGDPDVPADRAFIARYSGYQNLKPGVKYPEAYITTNTRDDRVHPGHARKYAAKLEAMGVPYLYYEQTFGGHANDADPELNARRWARHYVLLAQKLMD
ncbi:MAG: serine protease of the peptidase family [Phenylobacterium sp.]|nr:serine protease of the peptidase family [Phenylobacterium sp.]